jgi:hypothetical protein
MRPDPLVVLLGAEGVSELEGQSWLREASADETAAFVAGLGLAPEANPFLDRLGRPYWAMVLMPDAPEPLRAKARRYQRLVRLTD